jgi:hypothetical protein
MMGWKEVQEALLYRFRIEKWHCCKTLAVEDSFREFMRLDGWHEQARTRPLSHNKLVQI